MLHSLSKCLAATVALMAATSASAGTYYIAPNGKYNNDGSATSPWASINDARNRLNGGDTLIVKAGIYAGPVVISSGGTPRNPTIIKSEVKYGAVILGSPEIGISTSNGCNYVVIDGFEVTGSRGDGIKLSGDYNVVRNCFVHNNSRQGISSNKQIGTILERNLVEYNGQAPQFHHGIYVSGDKLKIISNIIRHNSGAAINTNGGITDSLIANNVIHGHHGDAAAVTIFVPAGGLRNYIFSNTIVRNNAGLRFYNATHDIIANNILMTNSGIIVPIEVNGAGAVVVADYNLCNPRTPYDGSHTLTGDPRFLSGSQGTFWLRADSPVIGKGYAGYVTRLDFWSRQRPAGAAPDLGAYSYSPYLTTELARRTWYYLWPYRYAIAEGMDIPDLWDVPQE